MIIVKDVLIERTSVATSVAIGRRMRNIEHRKQAFRMAVESEVATEGAGACGDSLRIAIYCVLRALRYRNFLNKWPTQKFVSFECRPISISVS